MILAKICSMAALGILGLNTLMNPGSASGCMIEDKFGEKDPYTIWNENVRTIEEQIENSASAIQDYVEKASAQEEANEEAAEATENYYTTSEGPPSERQAKLEAGRKEIEKQEELLKAYEEEEKRKEEEEESEETTEVTSKTSTTEKTQVAEKSDGSVEVTTETEIETEEECIDR